MTRQEETLADVASFLEATATPYMVVGGLANIVWGEPRATLDIDVIIWVDEAQIQAFLERLKERFALLVNDPTAFVRDTRVMPAEARTGVRVDFIFGLLPFEREAIVRAKPLRLAGTHVRVCTPEDLILMKIASTRERDLNDAQRITQRRRGELDLSYLEPRIEKLARLLDRPEISARWAIWKSGTETK